MEKYDVVRKLCGKLEKTLEQETGKTFLLVPFIEGLTVGFVLAKDCSIIYRVSFNLNGNIERAVDSASRQAEVAGIEIPERKHRRIEKGAYAWTEKTSFSVESVPTGAKPETRAAPSQCQPEPPIFGWNRRNTHRAGSS